MAKKDVRRTPAKEIVSEAELQRQSQRWMRGAQIVESLGKGLLWCAGIFFASYFGVYLPVKVSVGETTTISYTLNWLANIRVEFIVAVGAAAGFYFWGKREREKRLIEREERDKRIAELERKLDPERSSSMMTVDGQSAEDF